MSCGYLIHAYNNTEIDYGQMAICCGLLIKKNLKINSTALVTVRDTYNWMVSQHGLDLVNRAFDHVIITDIERDVDGRTFFDTRYSKKAAPYYNTNRSDSFDLSPFDETILIDADYLVLDARLDAVWGSSEDIMVNNTVIDLNHVEDLGGFGKRIGNFGIPMYWATVFYFKKNDISRSIFDTMKHIKNNYKYYQNLYDFPASGYFRNDYALSVALHMLSGQVECNIIKPLPVGHMMVATENDDLIWFNNGTAIFISEPAQGDFRLHKINTNIHIMNKWAIGRMASRIINYAIS